MVGDGGVGGVCVVIGRLVGGVGGGAVTYPCAPVNTYCVED